jgi:hypothetical protein
MPLISSGVSFSVPLKPGRLYASTTAPATVGMWTTLRGMSLSCWSDSAASLAPKSTVPALTCWMPPPLPID